MATISTLSTEALTVATEVEFRGHSSRATIAADLARHGASIADLDSAISAALEAGLIKEVPRLGGYCGTHATKVRVFGKTYADAWAA